MRVVLPRRQQQQQQTASCQPQQQQNHQNQNKPTSPHSTTTKSEQNNNNSNNKNNSSSSCSSSVVGECCDFTSEPDSSLKPSATTQHHIDSSNQEIDKKESFRKRSRDNEIEKLPKKQKDSTHNHKKLSASRAETTGISSNLDTSISFHKIEASHNNINHNHSYSKKSSSNSNLKIPQKKKAVKMGRVYNSQKNQSDYKNPPKQPKRDSNSVVVINNVYSEEEPIQQPQFDNDPVTLTNPFEQSLKKRGLEMAEQEGDGNCLFRAVSLQIYGDANMHKEVRRRCLDYMSREEAHFSQFVVDEPFRDYILRKRIDGVHGNNPEIQAISELFNRPVEVYVPSNGAKPLNIFHAEYKTKDIPIRLSYHDGNHYNAVIDPLCPTAGLGLGLPGLEPGLADKLQMQKAVAESDDLHVKKIADDSHKADLQRALEESRCDYQSQMLKQKAMALSDWDATDYEIEQAVIESSLESYNNLGGRKQSWRRRSQPSSPQVTSTRTTLSPEYSSSASQPYASRPVQSSHAEPSSISASGAAVASAAAASMSTAEEIEDEPIPEHLLSTDEYPQSVQELVMNGFELSKVVKAYELVGNNFDDMLNFLMSVEN